ncbi:hypothetical protein GCM10027443_30240 [Pontibacter brevis]
MALAGTTACLFAILSIFAEIVLHFNQENPFYTEKDHDKYAKATFRFVAGAAMCAGGCGAGAFAVSRAVFRLPAWQTIYNPEPHF